MAKERKKKECPFCRAELLATATECADCRTVFPSKADGGQFVRQVACGRFDESIRRADSDYHGGYVE